MTERKGYKVKTITRNSGLKTVTTKTRADAMKVARIYAQRNHSDNIDPKYGKVRVLKGKKSIGTYGYENTTIFHFKKIKR